MKPPLLKSILKVVGLLLLPSFIIPAHASECRIPKSYYKNVLCTSDSRYFLAIKDTGEPVALLNKAGKQSANLFAYDEVLYKQMQDGLLPVLKNGKVGYINGKGTVAVSVKYDSLDYTDGKGNWARAVQNGRIVVKKNGKFGVITTNEKVIVPFSAGISRLEDFSAGKAKMVHDGVEQWVDVHGKTTPIKRRSASPSKAVDKKPSRGQRKKTSNRHQSNQSNTARKTAKSQSRHTPSNRNQGTFSGKNNHQTPDKEVRQLGKDEISLSEDRINHLLEEYQLMPTDDRQSTDANATRKITTNPHNMKLFPHQSEGKWGFVDVNEVSMITYSFDQVTPFSSGLAGVQVAGNWGFINKAGDLVINFRFNETGVIRDKQTYHGMPPFMFYDDKAWVGNLNDGSQLCVNKMGTNVGC